MAINHALIKARKQLSLSQAEVAEKIEASVVSVSRWERGITLPTPSSQRALCKLYGKPREELFSCSDEMGKNGTVDRKASSPISRSSTGKPNSRTTPPLPDPLSQDNGFLYNARLEDSREFFGRRGDWQRLRGRSEKGLPTSIVGPRRIGKTWLMTYLRLVAPQELGAHVRIGYLDASLPSCATTLTGFLLEVLKELNMPTPADGSVQGYLQALERGVKEFKAKGLIPVLCLDKFDRLCTLPELRPDTLDRLRAITQLGLGLVTASRRPLTEVINDVFGETKMTSPFANVFMQLPLKPFTFTEALDFASAKGKRAGFTDEEIGYLLKYGRQKDAEFWLPQRLQLVGTYLHIDKTLAREGYPSTYRPHDPSYWENFEREVDAGSEEATE